MLLLAAGAVSTGSRTVTVPATTPAGTYRLLACADDTAKVVEGIETNNCAASTGSVQVLYPDLRQMAVNNPPATAAIGASVTMTDTVANQGAIATLTTRPRYYLSVDTIKDAADRLISASRSVASVAAGGSNTGSRVVTIPTIAAGTRAFCGFSRSLGNRLPRLSSVCCEIAQAPCRRAVRVCIGCRPTPHSERPLDRMSCI